MFTRISKTLKNKCEYHFSWQMNLAHFEQHIHELWNGIVLTINILNQSERMRIDVDRPGACIVQKNQVAWFWL